MNRKAIQEDKTAMKKGKFAVVRRLSTGRGQNVDRSMIMPTGSNQPNEHCRPVEEIATGRHRTERIADRSTPSSTGSNPDDL
ncbi:hypothetical protein M0R45_019376 [Rubus argutus]|uniref:Uncharacterized protein n=1 Tax=Rubus argutus TaxID=59490 RepID=A0AAW1X609_RUBAR